jgi:hypothetical protein
MFLPAPENEFTANRMKPFWGAGMITAELEEQDLFATQC